MSDATPGIRRRRVGRGFSYQASDGSPLRDRRTLDRIAALGIPPAWRDVWICPLPDGHIQATGRDAKGRKQYRYHPDWHAARDVTKYDRMLAFAEALPAIRAQVAHDLGQPGLTREKVLATVVCLLEATLIRIGNQEYARTNESYGLTTMLDEHVTVAGATISFQFRGKSGKDHAISIRDRRLARVVKRCQDLPGYMLFQYLDDQGDQQSIGSADVNGYLRAITGQDFTAKDFRTWAGTVLATKTLADIGPCDTLTEARRNVSQAIKQVAAQLGNTPAVCRKSYVYPTILESYVTGTLLETLQGCVVEGCDGHRPEEALVLTWLRGQGA